MRISKNEFRIDFIVIGVQKAGTTAVDYYLRQHPQIGMAEKKELHYFDNDLNFMKRKVQYSKYHENFNIHEKKINGEITPSYIYWRSSIQRIYRYNPKIKLIAILRNPVDRAYSHWNMSVKRNNESRPFLECINDQIAQITSNIHIQNLPNSYVERGLYFQQIKRIYEYFPRNQVLFIKYDEFLNKQEEKIKNMISFLGVDTNNSMMDLSIKQIFKIEYTDKISNKERLILQTFYNEDIKKVEMILGMDLSDWLK